MQYIPGILLQLAVIILTAPLVNGIIKKCKAFTQKRKGAPLLQSYYDIIKLFAKDVVISDKASFIFRIAPYILFSTALCSALFVPVATSLSLPYFAGDIFLVVYLMAAGKIFLALSGLDTASTFGGMGSSREMMISSLMEPGLIVAYIAIGLASGTTSAVGMMLHSFSLGKEIFQPVYLLAFIAVFITLIAETSRIPVDDPSTHLELTMVHEAMILEYSGRYLSLVLWGASIRQLVLITFICNVFIPFSLSGEGVMSVLMPLFIYFVKVVIVSLIIALVETMTVKLRIFSIPNLAALSFIAAFIGFIQLIVQRGGSL